MASSTRAHGSTIEAYLRAFWTATPVHWAGVDFDKPDEPWIQPRLLWGDAFEQAMGGSGAGKNVLVGVLSVNIFDRPGAGYGAVEDLADTLRDLFNRADLAGGIRFEAPSAPRPVTHRERGVRELEATHETQINVSIPFTVEETI